MINLSLPIIITILDILIYPKFFEVFINFSLSVNVIYPILNFMMNVFSAFVTGLNRF